MKLRILDKGFANLTGLFGTVEFVDGVSVESVSSAEAARLGTIISIEIVGTGVNPSTTQLMVDTHNKNMEELGLIQPGLMQPLPESLVRELVPESPSVAAGDSTQTPVLSWDFTEDQLDALVKKEGIAGLRAFSEQYGINGQSIAKIVKGLLVAQAEQVPVKQVEPEAPTETETETEAPTETETETVGEETVGAAVITQEPGFVEPTLEINGEEVLLADETPVVQEDHSDLDDLDSLEADLDALNEETQE